MQAEPRTTFRILCRCLTGALGKPLVPADLPATADEWAEVLRLSGDHLVTPQLRWALREQRLFDDLPAEVAEYLEAVYALNLERNRVCEDQLAQLIPALNRIGAKPVLLKGSAAIVGGLYPTSGERMMGDLDILVPVARLPGILATLNKLGYRSTIEQRDLGDARDLETSRHHHHYPMIRCPDWQAGVELHLLPVQRRYAELLSADDVFADATALSWRAGEVLLPSPGSFLAQNVIHSFLVNTQGNLARVSLRQLFEFVLATRTYGERVAWDAVVNRFAAPGYANSLREYAALANACLGQDLSAVVATDHRDQSRIQGYLTRLNVPSRFVEFGINCHRQLRRVQQLLRNPRKIRLLFTADFYIRLFRSF